MQHGNAGYQGHLRETERWIAELDASLVEQAKPTSAAAKTEDRRDDAGA
jgi:hypothetical protein